MGRMRVDYFHIESFEVVALAFVGEGPHHLGPVEQTLILY
jgi:hypothetical protein